jgi:pimeloyl-ACP methyl ester carboxylesterase
MIERAVTFGPEGGLVGILTEPDPAHAAPDRPGVILLNSGILHRVGASRIYVRIARQLAARGFPALRFDHGGVGDSAVRKDDGSFLESAIGEARQAMDLLAERRGVERFILAGLCSGSDMAYWTALEDERVVGLAQIDPFVYRTRRFLVRHYLPRLISPLAWGRSIRARTRYLLGKLRSANGRDEGEGVWVAPEYTRIFPPREEIAAGLRALRARGVSFWVFISGDMGEHINYATQYEESFPEVAFGDGLVVAYAPEANHTVTDLEDQKQVVEGIEAWAMERWGASAPLEVARR